VNAGTHVAASGARVRSRGLVALVAVYGALAVVQLLIGAEPIKDEVHYWPVALRFGSEGLAAARDYRALSTPLAFAIWGALGTIELARAFNLLVPFLIAFSIGKRSPLAAVGLLLFPYYVGTSLLMYTDILAAAFVLCGIAAYRTDRDALSAGCFVLAIASRQYMIAFPIALVLLELTLGERRARAALAQALAAASLLIWIALWRGFAPPLSIERWTPGTTGLLSVRPEHTLYFLACLGAYYVIPEALLARRIPDVSRNVVLASALILGGLFLAFPPIANVQALPTMGYLDRAAHVLPDGVRIFLFYLLALGAAVRFARRPSLELMLVVTNALLMSKAHVAWDKYALPLLVVLWYLYGSRDSSRAVARSGRSAPVEEIRT
jgi:hypothetical protein